MDTQYAYQMNYLVNKNEEPLPLFPPKTAIHRPSSEATDIFEEDRYHCYSDSSPIISVASFGTGSISTASTPDNVTTPNSTGLTAFDFHIDENHIRGPNGPHLFGLSTSSDLKSSTDVSSLPQQTPISTTDPYYHRASKFDPFRRDTPVPNRSTGPTPEPQQPQQPQQPQYPHQPTPIAGQTLTSVQTVSHDWTDWTTLEVVSWMQSLGFEDEILEIFRTNDICGSVLVVIEIKDLKEQLEIKSFGKRVQVMNAIERLRNGSVSTGTNTASSSSRNSSATSDVASTRNTSILSDNSCNSCSTADEEIIDVKPRTRRVNSDGNAHKRNALVPGDSVSIVAIEQLLPKLHQCSKGRECRKWQKQQEKLARLARDLPFSHFSHGRIVAGDPGNPQTAPNLLKSPKSPKTEITPSIIASSDIMGPGKPSAFQLSQEKLRDVKPRDPQENVRNFLNFQSLDRLKTTNQSGTPAKELVSSPGSESCDSAKVTPTLADHLRHLPKLRIPSMHNSTEESVFTENMSALRTITPSILSKRGHWTAVPDRQEFSSRDPQPSPADFYRADPSYRTETPLSDVDAPITAVPIGPVAREESQSVPPNMRFGNSRYVMEERVTRLSSGKMESHWRYPSTESVTTMDSLREGSSMSPIETPEDLQKTPRAPQIRNNIVFPFIKRGEGDVTHSGWMKKRKTTKLLCHDWEEQYFTLKGTQLSMHDDDDASTQQDSKALEYIDVDDYAVACSSLASRSKLTAAFRKTVLKRNNNPSNVSAFSFSLIPTPNGNGFVDRKTMFLSSGKSHHFAVKSRDERIDWMRELMLAKAFKRGRDTGAELTFNGANMI